MKLFNPPQISTKPALAKGYILIEVLITLGIFAFALLATALLQAKALQSTVSANQQVDVAAVVHDITSRMRGNLTGVSALNYNIPADGVPSVAFVAANAANAARRRAQIDFNGWLAHIQVLYGGTGEAAITCVTNPAPVALQSQTSCTFTINWFDFNTDLGTIGANKAGLNTFTAQAVF